MSYDDFMLLTVVALGLFIFGLLAIICGLAKRLRELRAVSTPSSAMLAQFQATCNSLDRLAALTANETIEALGAIPPEQFAVREPRPSLWQRILDQAEQEEL